MRDKIESQDKSYCFYDLKCVNENDYHHYQ